VGRYVGNRQLVIGEMGIKRILIAIFVVVSVLALVVLLLFQSGVDEKVIASFLPRLEKRFDVTIKYDKIDASLTSIVLESLTISDKKTGCTFAAADRIKVNVRVGPLFWGDVDLTGVRADDLEIRVGEASAGCEPSVWQNLLQHLKKGTGVENASESPSSRPEIVVNAGRMEMNDGHIQLSIRDINGRIGYKNKTVLEIGKYRVAAGGQPLMRGEGSDAIYSPDTRRFTVTTKSPLFEIMASRTGVLSLIRDAKASMERWRRSDIDNSRDKKAVSSRTDGTLPDLNLTWTITDGIGTLVNPDAPKEQIIIKQISAEVIADTSNTLNVNAKGTLPGTDAKFNLALQSKKDTNTTLSLKIPDVSLAHLGNVLLPSPHLDWTNASLDGEFHLSIGENGDTWDLSGQSVLTNLTIGHETAADEPLKDVDFNTDFKINYRIGENLLHLERLLVSRKLARFTLRGDIHFDRLAFDLQLNIPKTNCLNIRDAIPEELIPKLKNTIFEGKLSADIHLTLDESSPDEVIFTPTINNQCRISQYGDVPEPNYFRGPFTYVAYTEEREPLRLVTGPGTDRWTPYNHISPYLIEAVLTTEDGKFWHHAGITTPEIKRAIELNLKKNAWTHGASTITMQLAKNLFLDRNRTVARKLQEIILVWYLESYFTKEELLELYFNVVEFGPSIYGIRDAANHYFGREPSDLNLMESVYMIKLLPNPPARYKTYKRGKLSDRQWAMLRRVMKTMRDRNRLTDTELAEGLNQTIEFYKQGSPLPAPRIHGGYRQKQPISANSAPPVPDAVLDDGEEEVF
jgi:hypothetical protein